METERVCGQTQTNNYCHYSRGDCWRANLIPTIPLKRRGVETFQSLIWLIFGILIGEWRDLGKVHKVLGFQATRISFRIFKMEKQINALIFSYSLFSLTSHWAIGHWKILRRCVTCKSLRIYDTLLNHIFFCLYTLDIKNDNFLLLLHGTLNRFTIFLLSPSSSCISKVSQIPDRQVSTLS